MPIQTARIIRGQNNWNNLVLIAEKQYIGDHSFDLTQTPSEIIWKVIYVPVEDKKLIIYKNIKIPHIILSMVKYLRN